ncbi:MAG: hypothetical protein PVI78_06180 [Anaerolineales bacterium]|jgi:hypothetical protein
MIPITRQEREWFLDTIALGLVEYMGVAEPPVPVEDLLKHPPALFQDDFGVVDMRSNLWDATFARPLTQRGNIFVRMDLSPEERRYALAREMLSALITSRHGRSMGLSEVFLTDLQNSAEYFARALLMPICILRDRKPEPESIAEDFHVPQHLACERCEDLHHQLS